MNKIIKYIVFMALLVIVEGFAFRKLGINSAFIESLSDLQYLLYMLAIIALFAFNYFLCWVVGKKILED